MRGSRRDCRGDGGRGGSIGDQRGSILPTFTVWTREEAHLEASLGWCFLLSREDCLPHDDDCPLNDALKVIDNGQVEAS